VDELQDRLVRVGLDVLGEYGFALAGGYALQAHRLVERMSEDVDMFTDRWDADAFKGAVDALLAAYRREGLQVGVVRQADTFARVEAADPISGRTGSVDLAADSRGHQPVELSVGPVLAELDAVATKVATVFSRGYARDYLDLAGILDSGRYHREELMVLASNVDAGFSPSIFSEALAGVDRFADSEFARYGVDAARISRVRETMRDWSQALQREITQSEEKQHKSVQQETASPQVSHEAAPPAPDASPPQRPGRQPRSSWQASPPGVGVVEPSHEDPGLGL
jgi:hypothetical protein